MQVLWLGGQSESRRPRASWIGQDPKLHYLFLAKKKKNWTQAALRSGRNRQNTPDYLQSLCVEYCRVRDDWRLTDKSVLASDLKLRLKEFTRPAEKVEGKLSREIMLFENVNALPLYAYVDSAPKYRFRSRLRFDMARLNESLVRRRTPGVHSSKCAGPHCDEEESVYHVLCACPLYDVIRERFLVKLLEAGIIKELEMPPRAIKFILGNVGSLPKKHQNIFLKLSLAYIVELQKVRKF